MSQHQQLGGGPLIPKSQYPFEQYRNSLLLDVPIPIPEREYSLNIDNIRKYLTYLSAHGRGDIAQMVDQIINKTHRISFERFMHFLDHSVMKFLEYLRGENHLKPPKSMGV